MEIRFASPITLIVGASLLAACSSDGSMLGSSITTSSVGSTTTTAQAAAPKVDPACAPLSARIDTLRRDGVTDRVEKASVGKSATVQIKRASLAQMAELDKVNAEFQSKCTPFGARPAQVYAAPVTPAATSVITAKASPTPAAVVPPVITQTPKQ
jgi:hypothetical protein